MKPLYLSVKGLFSYRQEAEVDFTPLTDAGLFGIFGPVGSGKSSILDAITLALYGENDRLNAKDRRNYNLMNLQSRELKIQFRFIHGGEEYLFTVEGSRNSKNYDDVRTFKRRAYRIEQGTPRALHDDNRAYSAEEILGLSYKNFRRTIIIPQGRFQEFLQLNPSARRSMMKELFGLEKYDLKPPTSALIQKTKERLSSIEGSLAELEDATEEEFVRIEQELQASEEREHALNEKKGEALAALEEFNQLEELFSRFEDAKTAFEGYRERWEEIERRRESLNRYEECSRRFTLILHRVEEKIQAYLDSVRGQREAAEERKRLEKAYEQSTFNLEQRAECLEQRDTLEEKARQLEALASMGKVQNKIEVLNTEIEQYSEQQQKAHEAIEKLREEQGRLHTRETELEGETALFGQMSALSEWYNEQKELLRRRQEAKQQLDEARQSGKRDIVALHTAATDLSSTHEVLLDSLIAELFSMYRELDHCFSSTGGSGTGGGGEAGAISFAEELAQNFEAAEYAVQGAIQGVRQDMVPEETRKSIEKLSRDLESGRPCPVCGSPDHPRPAHLRKETSRGEIEQGESAQGETEQSGFEQGESDRGTEKSLEEQEKRIISLEEIRNSLIEYKAKCTGGLKSAEERLKVVYRLSTSLEGIEKSLRRHRERFHWEDFSPEDERAFKRAQDSARSAHEELVQVRDALRKNESEIEGLTSQQNSIKTKLQDLSNDQAVLNHQFSEEKAKITEENMRSFSELSSEDLAERASECRTEVKQNELNYKEAEAHCRECELALSRAQVSEKERRERRASIVDEISTAALSAAKELETSEYSSLKTVRRIVAVKRDVEGEREEIETFNRSYSAAKEKFSELESQTREKTYNRELHEETRQKAGNLEAEYSELLKNKAVLQHRIELLRNRLQRKKGLQEENERTVVRIDNLNELFRLFKGQGFVNFVATRYLHDLCARANERFFHLTRKQLRLEINGENDFVIRDFLNGGRLRSVKTLSGGQMFQASFSLALALADSIHQNKESFFFLDEGFGSLDRRSLQDVFDTLKSLRKENRIVGVISHVEELREEIPVSLQVSEDPEYGSRIISSL